MKSLLNKWHIPLLFLLMNIHVGKTPLPSPYYLYYASGYVEGDSLTDRENFAVQLFGMHQTYQPEFKALAGTNSGPERPVALTDSSGYFIIVVSDHTLFDSLKAGIVQPDKPVVFSPAYYVDENRLKEVYEYYEPDEGPGCSGCSTMQPMESRIVRYEYYLDDVVIDIREGEKNGNRIAIIAMPGADRRE